MVLQGLKKALNTVNGLKQCMAEINKKNKPKTHSCQTLLVA